MKGKEKELKGEAKKTPQSKAVGLARGRQEDEGPLESSVSLRAELPWVRMDSTRGRASKKGAITGKCYGFPVPKSPHSAPTPRSPAATGCSC